MNNFNSRSLAFVFFTMLVVVACRTENSTEKKIVKYEDRTSENIPASPGDLELQKETLTKDLEDSKASIDRRIENLKSELTEANEITKEKINEQLEDLDSRRKLLVADIEKVEIQIADNWNDFELIIKKRLKEIEEELDEGF